MPGLDDVLQQLGSTADHFLGSRLGVEASPAGFTSPGRFTFGGLIALLSLGARDRARTVPDQGELSTVDPALLQAALARAHSPVRPAEVDEALDLLRTGAVATDVTSSMRVILRLVRRLPSDLFKDALDLPRIPGDVVSALEADFSATCRADRGSSSPTCATAGSIAPSRRARCGSCWTAPPLGASRRRSAP
jgi:hypothetical protein